MGQEIFILAIGVLFYLAAAFRDRQFRKFRDEFEQKRKTIFEDAEKSALEYVSTQIDQIKKDRATIEESKANVRKLIGNNNKVVLETNRKLRTNLESMIRYHEKLSDLVNQLLCFDEIHGEQSIQLEEFLEQLTYQHTALEDYYFSVFGQHFTFEKEIKRFKDSGLN